MTDKKPFVVVVDDNDDDRFFLNEALTMAHYDLDIMEMADGEQAIDFIQYKCKKRTPQLILLDLNMPKKNGFEVLQFLRQNPESCKSRIVVFSTSNSTKDIRKARDLGAYDYFIKPDEFSGYMDIIGKLKAYIN